MNSIGTRAENIYLIEHQKDKNANVFYDDFLILLEAGYFFMRHESKDFVKKFFDHSGKFFW